MAPCGQSSGVRWRMLPAKEILPFSMILPPLSTNGRMKAGYGPA